MPLGRGVAALSGTETDLFIAGSEYGYPNQTGMMHRRTTDGWQTSRIDLGPDETMRKRRWSRDRR